MKVTLISHTQDAVNLLLFTKSTRLNLSRFAISNLTHIDSIHDDAVYAAMIEAIIINQ